MSTRFLESILSIKKQDWNALWPDYPFTRHEFLSALEVNHCTSEKTGWKPLHLVIEDNNKLLAALPLFIKSDSWGEYVFDWAWADAYHRSGLDYYPKLLNAIPFTPATGPRIGFDKTLSSKNKQQLSWALFDACKEKNDEISGSGFHCLFPQKTQLEYFKGLNLHQRTGCQFHWFNQNFNSFEEFLNTFNSRKRKALKKERQKVQDAKVEIEILSGKEISEEYWHTFFIFYHTTYLKRSGRYGYLTKEFFLDIAESMPDSIVLIVAKKHGSAVAMALYFRDKYTLYGRYWGCSEDIDCLHFELCYYQGIEYAIKNRLQRFDPGAQGEHKIQRGFTPVYTTSFHCLNNDSFNQAVGEFVKTEKLHLQDYLKETRKQMPFKDGFQSVNENILLTELCNQQL